MIKYFCYVMLLLPKMLYAAMPLSLEGQWQSNCLPIGENGANSTKAEIKISGNFLSSKTGVYYGANCQDLKFTIIYDGAFTPAESEQGIVNLTHQVKNFTFVPGAEKLVGELNQLPKTSECGIGIWQLNQAYQLTGKKCGKFVFRQADELVIDRAAVKNNVLSFEKFPFKWRKPEELNPGKNIFVPNFHFEKI